MTKVKAAGLPSFAGLLAGWAPKGKRAEDENQTSEDDEARKARRAEEDERRKEEDARRAEEDKLREEEDAERAEDGDGDGAGDDEGDEAAKGKKAKKAKKADDDDDQDPEADSDDGDDEAEDDMDEKEAKAFRRGLAVGRTRELMRCARIFGTAEAVSNPGAAVTLAFTTRNTSAEAGRLLATFGQAQAPKRGRSLDERMATTKNPDVGASGGRPGGPTTAEQIIAAGKKRRGEI